MPGEQGQLSGGIYQWTQLNLQLFARSTLSKLVTSLLSAPLAPSQPPSPPEGNHPSGKRKRSQRWALPLQPYTITGTIPAERGALASNHTYSGVVVLHYNHTISLAPNSEGNQTWLLHNPGMHSQTRAGQTDRKTHPFPPVHTEVRTAPGSVPQTMQKGNGPIPLGKAKEASFEISGMPKSWAHTPNPWRASLETWSQPCGTWHEYNVLRNSVCDCFRYRGLNFLVKSHWVHSQHAPITSRFVCFIYVFFLRKTN